VRISVYNAEGKLFATLLAGKRPAGEGKVTWYAEGIPSGVYFCRMQFENHSIERKMVVLK